MSDLARMLGGEPFPDSPEVVELKRERDEYKTKYENLTSFESVYSEVEILQHKLAERDKIISDALFWIKAAQRRNHAGVPYEDELNEVLAILSGIPDAVIKVNEE